MRRSLLVVGAALALIGGAWLLGPAPAGAAAPRTPAAVSGTTTPSSVAPAATTPAATGSTGPHVLTKTERAILGVVFIFLVGAGLLAPSDEETEKPKRPAITLYDDPAAIVPAAPSRRRAGEPPPLR